MFNTIKLYKTACYMSDKGAKLHAEADRADEFGDDVMAEIKRSQAEAYDYGAYKAIELYSTTITGKITNLLFNIRQWLTGKKPAMALCEDEELPF